MNTHNTFNWPILSNINPSMKLVKIPMIIKSSSLCRWNDVDIILSDHKCKYLHHDMYTYIYDWPLQPLSLDYGLVSHITHVVCVNFLREWRDQQFNVDPEWQIFWETFSWQVYLFSEFLPEICWRNIFFHISFWSRALRLISQHAIMIG